MGEKTDLGIFMRKRFIKKIILMSIDILLIMLAYLCAIFFRYYMEGHTITEMIGVLFAFKARLLLSLVILLICQLKMRQYQSIWTLASLEDFALGTISFIIGTIVNLMLSMAILNRIPFLVTILAGILAMVLCNGVRIAWRMLRRIIISSQLDQKGQQQRVLIYGAGSAGTLVLNEYKRNPHLGKKVIGFLDDDSEKFGTVIGATPVLGERKDLETIINDYQIDEVIIAIAHLDYSILNEVSVKAKRLNILVKTMPGLFELIDGKFNVGMIRDVSVEELLARDSIQLDYDGISDYLEHQVVMVTGGGGSIGSELCRQIAKFHPTQLIIVDIYENNAYDLQNELRRQYPQLNLVTLIASVRERDRLKEIYETYRPDVVFHAAAHKHVPLMEDSPAEAIKNNVVGTLHTAELASEYGVKRFVLISTDKAVNPTNVMGATKRLCEMIIQALNPTSQTDFVAVRFGNVLGSNGSVVPLFKKQIAKGGPVTLTHKEIVRYFMTIPEAAQLVLQAGGFAQGGEIFVLDMGKPVKIYDLAENLIKLSGYEPHTEIEIQVTGLRPGEKLYEELLMDEEGLTETDHKKIFIGKPGDFELHKVKRQINELLDVATTKGSLELKAKLKEVVPTYQEPEHHKTNVPLVQSNEKVMNREMTYAATN